MGVEQLSRTTTVGGDALYRQKYLHRQNKLLIYELRDDETTVYNEFYLRELQDYITGLTDVANSNANPNPKCDSKFGDFLNAGDILNQQFQKAAQENLKQGEGVDGRRVKTENNSKDNNNNNNNDDTNVNKNGFEIHQSKNNNGIESHNSDKNEFTSNIQRQGSNNLSEGDTNNNDSNNHSPGSGTKDDTDGTNPKAPTGLSRNGSESLLNPNRQTSVSSFHDANEIDPDMINVDISGSITNSKQPTRQSSSQRASRYDLYAEAGHFGQMPNRFASGSVGLGLGPYSPSNHSRKASHHSHHHRKEIARLSHGGMLQTRDLRALNSAFSSSNEPGIFVRKGVILLNFDPIRAIALHDRLLVLIPNGADSIIRSIEQKLYKWGEDFDNGPAADDHPQMLLDDETSQSLPFELKSVEATLGTVFRNLKKETASLEPIVRSYINQLDRGDFRKQSMMSDCKDRINLIESRVRSVRRALLTILDEDEDMILMNLSKIRNHNNLYNQLAQLEDSNHSHYEHGNSDHNLDINHEDVELLLEANLQEVAGLATKLELLRLEMDNAENVVKMRLDAARNKLLTITTVLSVASTAFAFASMVTGIFGMNLENGWDTGFASEEVSRKAFKTVVTAVCSISLGSIITLYMIFVYFGIFM